MRDRLTGSPNRAAAKSVSHRQVAPRAILGLANPARPDMIEVVKFRRRATRTIGAAGEPARAEER
jgi:hypothetical protein